MELTIFVNARFSLVYLTKHMLVIRCRWLGAGLLVVHSGPNIKNLKPQSVTRILH